MRRFIVSLVCSLLLGVSFFNPMPQQAKAQSASPVSIYLTGTGGQVGGVPATINVFSPTTGKYEKTINVSTGGLNALEASPDGKRIYATGQTVGGAGQISVISTASNTVIDTIVVDPSPEVTVSPDTTKLFVVGSSKDRLNIIDVATHAILRTVPLGRAPGKAAVSPDGKTVLVPIMNSCPYCTPGTVLVIDVATGTVKPPVQVGYRPTSVVVNPAGTKAYVTNQFSSTYPYQGTTISVIDLTTNKPQMDITVGKSPITLGISPNGQRVYVANDTDGTLSVVDTTSNKVLATIPIGKNPRGVVVTPDGSKIYVNNVGDFTISVITNNNTFAVTTLNPPFYQPWGMVLISPPQVIPSLATKPTVVVLLQGIGTGLTTSQIQTMQENCTSTDVFPNVVNALVDVGFKCSDLLLYSYAGGATSTDSAHKWVPNPYDCSYTVNLPTSLDVTTLQTMLQLYRQDHPGVRFVLLGHSLGGYIAFQSSAATDFPAGTIPVVVTLDSPLNHGSLKNLQDARTVVPLSSLLSDTMCSARAMFYSTPGSELGDVTDLNRQSIRNAQRDLVARGHARGVTYITIGNQMDCLWYLRMCKLQRRSSNNVHLAGDWIDDRMTMIVDNSDSQKLYALGNQGCDLSTGLPFSLPCLNDPHGVALKDSVVISDILSFLSSKL